MPISWAIQPGQRLTTRPRRSFACEEVPGQDFYLLNNELHGRSWTRAAHGLAHGEPRGHRETRLEPRHTVGRNP